MGARSLHQHSHKTAASDLICTFVQKKPLEHVHAVRHDLHHIDQTLPGMPPSAQSVIRHRNSVGVVLGKLRSLHLDLRAPTSKPTQAATKYAANQLGFDPNLHHIHASTSLVTRHDNLFRAARSSNAELRIRKAWHEILGWNQAWLVSTGAQHVRYPGFNTKRR